MPDHTPWYLTTAHPEGREAARAHLLALGYEVVNDTERDDIVIIRAAPAGTLSERLAEFEALNELVASVNETDAVLITHYGEIRPDLSPEQFFAALAAEQG